jgi:2-haloacid dehalogenase
MVAERQGVELSDEDKQQTLGGMQVLPPHPEVEESLGRLRDACIRLVALTNSTQQVANAQIDNAGLRDYFEQELSADTAPSLKPAPAPYRMAAAWRSDRSGSWLTMPGIRRTRCEPGASRPL